MSAGRVTDKRLLIAAGALTVLLAAATAIVAPPEGPATPAPSSYSAAAGGGKAAFLTLRALGYDVERSFEPMTAIASEPEQTVLILAGPAPPSDQDRRALERFLTAGGTALLVGRAGLTFLGVATGPSTPDTFASDGTYTAAGVSPLAANAPEITMASPSLAPRLGPSQVTVFAASPDHPLVTTASVGQGRVIWLAAPTPLANAHIGSAHNFQLLLNVLGPPGERRVLWDEHYHGHRRSLWSYAAATPLPWIAGQLGVITLAGFAVFARRRGPIRAPRSDPRTSVLEFIEMLLVLYRRANARGAVVASAQSRLRRTIASLCGLPIDASDEMMARAYAARRHVEENEVRQALQEARRVTSDPRLDDDTALRITAKLQSLTAALTKGRE